MPSKAMEPNRPAPPSLRDYLTVRSAAELLGVSISTLRNWDRRGKLKAVRHPVNGYRLYRAEDLQKLLKTIDTVGNGSQSRRHGQGRTER
jgi:excisionase family DNA binding protein